MPKKLNSKKAIITTDTDAPITISNKVTIAMLKALSNQQRKRPDTYLDDLINHQYLYLQGLGADVRTLECRPRFKIA